MNREEFIKLYKNIFKDGNPEKYAKFAFKVFDTNNNGEISFSEFLTVSAFDLYDIDKNGKVSKREALQIFKAIDELKSGTVGSDVQKRVDELFKNYDLNGNGFLEKNEFIVALFDNKIPFQNINIQ